MRYSLVLPVPVIRPEQAVPFASLVRWSKAERLWQGQSDVIDNHQLVSWLAGIGIRVPSGFGVNLSPLRSPYHAAVEARSTALTTGCSVIAAYGPGPVEFQRGVMGDPYHSPLTAIREYVATVRALVNGELVNAQGDCYSTTGRLVPARSAEVRVGVGVLRPKMASLAGQIADDAVAWLCPPDYLRDVIVPQVHKASTEKGRDPVPVTAIVPCAVAREGRHARDIAFDAFGMHIQYSHYQDTLRHAGIEVTGKKEDADKLIDAGLFLYGTPSDIRDGLDRFSRAGVEEVVLNVVGVAKGFGLRAATHDLEEILNAV
ncbi:Flavin-dependent oxidoreductase, luciferase family (includes alkanesulfonate monooxygenase SsuD and methylene tetrahydromethanopterin reductase) [Streptomyces sp. cf124]|nr:Flavin-dependent oxidoreductase, luciferase family (includes alkanesulfonate monooxygenase SsuD and methylene tetrahydromethanopterin reductase) [Streptomyces sp. cf124]